MEANSEQETQQCLTEPSEPLSRALKRKFTELDEITQRLRLRLSKVVEDESDASSDGFADQFEKDVNTLSIEEDFDLVNFEKDAEKINLMQTSEPANDSDLLMTDSKEKSEKDDKSISLSVKEDKSISLSENNYSQPGSEGTSSGQTIIGSK